jgi:hypothetical protein
MQDFYWKKLEKCLSQDRIAVYGKDNPGHRTMAARYLWNIAVSESLYAPLHLLEVGLRNAIHHAMANFTGLDTWYDTIELTAWGKRQVDLAKRQIQGCRKSITSGRVVAELKFGFWTSMFESHYEKSTAKFLPRGIKATFPEMPKSSHHRKQIKGNLDKIRKLRNRIFHYERIIHWQDLPQQHLLIFQFLEWLNPDLAEFSGIVDTFSKVYREGTQPFLDKLDGHLVEKPFP